MMNARQKKKADKKSSINSESFKITADWSILSQQLKEKFSQLTDADLKFEPGKENELISRIEIRLNKKREEVINIIKKGQPDKGQID